MGGEWREHEVRNLIDAGVLLIGDGYRAKNEELRGQGLPFARAGNINRPDLKANFNPRQPAVQHLRLQRSITTRRPVCHRN